MINRTSFASIWRHRRPHELTGCALGLRNPSAKCLSWGDFGNTLLATKISPPKGVLKMIFLFSRWDMLVPWRLKSNLPRCKVSKKIASMRSVWKVKIVFQNSRGSRYLLDSIISSFHMQCFLVFFFWVYCMYRQLSGGEAEIRDAESGSSCPHR